MSPENRTSLDWDNYLLDATAYRAAELLVTFGQQYATEGIKKAGNMYSNYLSGDIGKLPSETDAIHDYTTMDRKDFVQAWGIALDFPILTTYVKSHVEHPKFHDGGMSEQEVSDEISELLALGESINLETVLIGATHNLAVLDTYDAKSPQAEQALSQAEFIYATLCEIIGFDGLAAALRSKVSTIRLREGGHDAIVAVSEQIAQHYDDGTGNYETLTNHFISSIVAESFGDYRLTPALTSDPKHGIVIITGEPSVCAIAEGDDAHNENIPDKRIIARLKTVGSRADKMYRNYEERLKSSSSQSISGELEPNMDDFGDTLVTQDDNELAEEFINMVKRMRSSEKITPFPSPSRRQAYHISGSKSFKAFIRAKLEEAFPDEDIDSTFDIKPADTGFHVAKATGFYEDEKGCVAFENQVLTREGREDARSGKSAHAWFKLMRLFDIKIVPNDHQVAAMNRLNERKEHFGGDGLCPESEIRLESLIWYLETVIKGLQSH